MFNNEKAEQAFIHVFPSYLHVYCAQSDSSSQFFSWPLNELARMAEQEAGEGVSFLLHPYCIEGVSLVENGNSQ